MSDTALLVRLENAAQTHGYTLTALKRTILEMKYQKMMGSEMLDVLMPNGKQLRDSTGTEVGAMGKALEEVGKILEQEEGELDLSAGFAGLKDLLRVNPRPN